MLFLRTFLIVICNILLNYNSYSSDKITCSGVIKSWNNCFGTALYKYDGKNNKYKGRNNKYIGEYKNGFPSGQGIYKFADGDKYEGEWKDGIYNGQGIYTFANGDKYAGMYNNGLLNGYGFVTFVNGDKYEGNWKDGTYSGQGNYKYSNGEKYKGEYKNGRPNGYGIASFPKGNKYEGYFRNGLYYGQGIFTFANGNKYEGEWKDGKYNGQGIFTYANGQTKEGIWKENVFLYSKSINKQSTQKKISTIELHKEKLKRMELEQKIASLEQEKLKRIELEKKLATLQSINKKQIKQNSSNEIGSGFYVSKFRHIVTNQHVVNKCKKITVGDSISKQIPATLFASDKRNDLAILQTISMEMASADTKSFIQNLSIEIVPIISGGLIRSEDVKGGEEIVVAGYPLGNMVSDTIKVTKGIVSATRGMDNNFSQFEIDAVIRKGNSGGPIYDKRGNIVGVAVSRLSVNRTDTINFGIKGSTVKQFLSANDVPTTWANRAQRIDTQDLYKIASKQTVMVVCHRD